MATRILIVEDEYIIAADLEMTLGSMGYEVAGFAVTGEEAVRLAETQRPDLVLMDIQLQGPMDGLEAAKAIRSRSPVPIIFITAFTGMLLGEKQGEAPSESCLTKPFSAADLKERLEAVLERELFSD